MERRAYTNILSCWLSLPIRPLGYLLLGDQFLPSIVPARLAELTPPTGIPLGLVISERGKFFSFRVHAWSGTRVPDPPVYVCCSRGPPNYVSASLAE